MVEIGLVGIGKLNDGNMATMKTTQPAVDPRQQELQVDVCGKVIEELGWRQGLVDDGMKEYTAYCRSKGARVTGLCCGQELSQWGWW